MHSLWSGSLSFGLINIPVKVYSATEEHVLDFRMLHKKDLSPIRYARICKAEETEVPYEDIVKGVEFEKGNYVVVTEKDFKQADVEKTKSIQIKSFSSENEIDSIYYEKPYFLEPDKGASKPFALLREALKKSKKVAVATFVLRNREHLMIIKPYKAGIVLNQLRYADEIRSMTDLKLPEDEKLNSKELEMAITLIAQLTEKFKPTAFQDNYTESLKKTIANKAKGRKVPSKKGRNLEPTKVYDMMSRLKASLKQSQPHRSRRRTVRPPVKRKSSRGNK